MGNLNIADEKNNRIRKVTFNNSINEFENTKQLNLYPNPCTGILNFNTSMPVNEINIANVLGEEIKNEGPISKGNSIQLDLIDLPDGVYFVKVKTPEGILTGKIIKQK